jgi:DNA polymerase-3 subunit alpha
MNKYTPLHVHSDASLLDGLSKPKDIVKRIHKLGLDGCALTDHGVISNTVEFLKAMEGFEIVGEDGEKIKCPKKPVLGIELYISDEHASIKTPENRKALHLCILAKNTQGWKQILKIVAESNLEANYYYKPRLSLEQLSHFLDGNIIGFSGHLGSNLASAIQEFGEEAGVKTARYLESIFGKGNFWCEVQLMDRAHNTDMVATAEAVRRIAVKTGIPVLATPDAHYTHHEDAELQRILLCSNMGVNMKQAMRPDFPLRTFFISDNYHIPTYEEMVSYGHTQEELDNTNKILDSIEKYDILSEPKLPPFPCEGTEEDYVTALCREGWKKLIVPHIDESDIPVYVERVKYELDVIKRNNLCGYFLILWDIINFCRQKGWLTGVGRGSSAGCLVAYLLGITQIDSVKYGLLFERFYNDGRAGSLPDIDCDFETEHREEIIDYIREKYGAEKVTQIVTFSNIKGKKAISAVFSAYDDMPFEEVKRITNNIIEEHKITDELQAMEEIEEGSASILRWCLENRPKQFAEWCTIDDEGNLSGQYADRFSQAMRLEGVKSAQSRHAGGVVVSRDKIDDICPMILDTKAKKPIGGLTMNYMEAIGLCKMDILGVRVLDKIAMIARLNPDFVPDFTKMGLYDQPTWDLFASGKTKGCFQLESQLGKSMSKKLKPENIEQLSALVAILRPGCLESELDDGKSITEHFVKRKNNEEEVSYVHESTADILKETYGLLVYQESAMLLAAKIAGFNLKQADDLRKAIGKKKADLMAKIKVLFLEGVEKQGIVSTEIGEQIFGWIEKSQRYSFNKSHSMSYAMCSYMTAFAKVHFMKEFYTAFLYYSSEKPKPQEEIYQLINDAKAFDIYIQPPSIRLLNPHFALIDGQIYFGLSDIKYVGESAVEKLKKVMKVDASWYDFLLNISDYVDSRVCRALINAGACDSFGLSRTKMAFEYEIFSELSPKEKKWINNNVIINEKTTLKGILEAISVSPTGKAGACHSKVRLVKINGLIESMNNPPYELVDKPHQVAKDENALLGVCLTATFLDESKCKYKANCSCQQFNDGFTNTKNSYISVACQIDNVKETTVKRGPSSGQEMAILTISDETGIIESAPVFSDFWAEYSHLLCGGNRVLISGKRGYDFRTKKNTDSFIVEQVEQI